MENMALAGNGKAKKRSSKGPNPKGEKKDLSKVKCYGCHEFNHYVNNCLQRKKTEKKGKK